MRNFKQKLLLLLAAAMWMLPVWSQWTEEELEQRMTHEVEVLNPVYMPVLGVGAGYFSFYGNVNDAYRSQTIGKPGIRMSMTTFLDSKNHYLRGSLVFLTGQLTGTQRYVPETPGSGMTGNLNFSSNIYSFGINVQYNFKPWLKSKIFEPFISLGIETLQFDTKADYSYGDDQPYYFWTDGTIRVAPEPSPIDPGTEVEIIARDYDYETDLRSLNQTGLGKYSQFSAAIPVEAGIDFNISGRVTLRAATSLHYAFTDMIDDMSPKSKTDYKGTRNSNLFTYSYLSLHVDLFSPPRTKIIEDLTVNIDDFDMTMYDDEDGDGKFDGWDECPGTPPGVPIDSLGCPFDTDADGVPDHIDREKKCTQCHRRRIWRRNQRKHGRRNT
jgi:hypothetical protein